MQAASRVQASEQEVAEATAALDQANQTLDQAEDDLQTAQAERDQARALAKNAQICAAGSLNAISLLAADDIDGAVAALKQAAPACEATFEDENQPTS